MSTGPNAIPHHREGGHELRAIQYLRAGAVLAVVVYHAMRWVGPGFAVGAAGVDVFFVISGFILWTIAAERPLGPARFLWKRWVRVAPLYWLLTLAVAACSVAWPWMFWAGKASAKHVIMSLAFLQHLNPEGEPFPVIPVGWSLNYEVLFYALFSVSLAAPARHRLKLLTAMLLAVPLVGIFVWRPGYYLGINMMFLQFVAGVWLAELRLRGRLPARRIGAAAAIAGVAIFLTLWLADIYDNLWRPILWGAPAFLIVAGCVSVEADGGVQKIGWLKFLGDASYAIYLVHFIVIHLLSHVLYAGDWWFAPLAAGAGLALGAACHLGLERPLAAAFRGKERALLPSGAI